MGRTRSRRRGSQLHYALDVLSDEEAASTLDLDRKRLCENLTTAQGEVVATATRLCELARARSPRFSDQLVDLLTVSETGALMPYEERANPLLFSVVALFYHSYRALPGAIRHQFNVALRKLRESDGEN